MQHIKLLKISQLEDLMAWCEKNRIKFRPGRGKYEILQVRLAPHWHAIYKRTKNHGYLTVPKQLIDMVIDFTQGLDWIDLRGEEKLGKNAVVVKEIEQQPVTVYDDAPPWG